MGAAFCILQAAASLSTIALIMIVKIGCQTPTQLEIGSFSREKSCEGLLFC